MHCKASWAVLSCPLDWYQAKRCISAGKLNPSFLCNFKQMTACWTAPKISAFFFLNNNMSWWISCTWFCTADFLSVPPSQNLITQKSPPFILTAISALSFRCSFHNPYFRTISHHCPSAIPALTELQTLCEPCMLPPELAQPFVLISIARLSKLFFMSSCTGCQLLPSSLASCFNRTEIKEFWLFHW